MGNSSPRFNLIGFDDMIEFISDRSVVLITTMSDSMGPHRIVGTLSPTDEIDEINRCIANCTHNRRIVIYGENSSDESGFRKSEQLRGMGFTDIYVYGGGLFEWILLQDIYGADTFKTNQPIDDILRYKGNRRPSRVLVR
jgi:hypothetical protein